MATATKSQGKTKSQQSGAGKRPGNMIRVPDATHNILKEIASETGEQMSDLLVEAVEAMRRRRMLEMTNAAYAAMRQDPVAWQAELDEREEWEETVADGLEAE